MAEDDTADTKSGVGGIAKATKSDKTKQTIGVVAAVVGTVIGYMIYRSSKKTSAASVSQGSSPVGAGGGNPIASEQSPGSGSGVVGMLSDQYQTLANQLSGISKTQQTQQSYLDSIQMGTQMGVVGIGTLATQEGYGPTVVGHMADWQKGYPTNTQPGFGWTIPGVGTQTGYQGTAPGNIAGSGPYSGVAPGVGPTYPQPLPSLGPVHVPGMEVNQMNPVITGVNPN